MESYSRKTRKYWESKRNVMNELTSQIIFHVAIVMKTFFVIDIIIFLINKSKNI
jgi:hypothetical protein